MKSSVGSKQRKESTPETDNGLDRFYQAVVERRIADAEKELDLIRASVQPTESGKGYLKACEGLILTAKANSDKYLYLSKIEKTPKQLDELRKGFSRQAENPLHADYDRAYFKVLEGYTIRLGRDEKNQPKSTARTKTD